MLYLIVYGRCPVRDSDIAGITLKGVFFMTTISALDALNAAVKASDSITDSNPDSVDFSSYLNTNKSLDDIYTEASQTYGVSKELLKAMTKQESNFNPNATSRSGAQGLMQLMPSTAASLGVTDSYDPYQNIMGGAKYIRKMLDKYNGDVSLALAAYNAGSNNVDKYGGIPPFAETQNYVAKITGYLQQGVDIPDNSAVYTVSNTIPDSSSVTYQDLNDLAGELLTEIFSYDDYMKYLTAMLGQEKTGLSLSLQVTVPKNDSTDSPENDTESNVASDSVEQNTEESVTSSDTANDALLAYERLNGLA